MLLNCTHEVQSTMSVRFSVNYIEDNPSGDWYFPKVKGTFPIILRIGIFRRLPKIFEGFREFEYLSIVEQYL